MRERELEGGFDSRENASVAKEASARELEGVFDLRESDPDCFRAGQSGWNGKKVHECNVEENGKSA